MNFPSPILPREFDLSKVVSDSDLDQVDLSGKEDAVFVVAATDLAPAQRKGRKGNEQVQVTDHKIIAELGAAGKLSIVTSKEVIYGPRVNAIAKKAFEEGTAEIYLDSGHKITNVSGRMATPEEYKRYLTVFLTNIKSIQEQHSPDKQTEYPSLKGRVTHTNPIKQRDVKLHFHTKGSALRKLDKETAQVFTELASQIKAKQDAKSGKEARKIDERDRGEAVRELRKKAHSQGAPASVFTDFPRDTSKVQGLNRESQHQRKRRKAM